jgi:MraZ protein
MFISGVIYAQRLSFINNVVKSGKKWNRKIYIWVTASKPASLLMVNFIGTYDCKADAKGRFMMPTGLKKQLTPIMEQGFVIKRAVFQPCLELYPMEQWNVLMQKLNGLNRFNRKHNDFIRRFTAGVKTVEMDVSGRILIPKDLISVSGITKEITVASAINIIEIWDKTRYEEAIDNASEDFADLAQEVMGNDSTDILS